MQIVSKPINRKELSKLRQFGQKARRQLNRRYGSQWVKEVRVNRGWDVLPYPFAVAWLTGPDKYGFVTVDLSNGVWVFDEQKLRNSKSSSLVPKMIMR